MLLEPFMDKKIGNRIRSVFGSGTVQTRKSHLSVKGSKCYKYFRHFFSVIFDCQLDSFEFLKKISSSSKLADTKIQINFMKNSHDYLTFNTLKFKGIF